MDTRKFPYKELDQEGLDTLETLAGAHRFNRWMYDTVVAHLQPGLVIEVGSGIGNLSRYFLEAGWSMTLSDVRENYCGYLEATFSGEKGLLDIVKLDLVHPDFELVYAEHVGKYDNLYALNVIEHIEDDVLALRNCRKLLRPGGRLVILVPAYQWLYNSFDKHLFHFRRYTRATLAKAFLEAGILPKAKFHFNAVGIAGWFVSGSLLRKQLIPAGQMKLFNKLVPAFKLIDRVIFNQMGLSVVVVGMREEE